MAGGVLFGAMKTWLMMVALAVAGFDGALSAAAPETLSGMTYFEETLRFFVRSDAAQMLQLRSDRSYRGVYVADTYGTVRPYNAPDGTWAYRKTGENTGELTLDRQIARTLVFTSETEGSLSAPTSPALTGRFSLSDPAARPPLVNCSNRAFVPARGRATAGFVVTAKTNHVLVRAIGPGLTQFGVRDVLATPMLTVFSGDRRVAENVGWSAGVAALPLRRASDYAGAFPLQEGSGDSAVIVILPPGAYTAQATGASEADQGEVLVEVYTLQ